MKKLAIAISLFIAASANAKCIANDSWGGPDKVKHFAAGAAIGSAGTVVFKDPHKGFLAGVLVGGLKEAYDAKGHGTCSVQDFAVTALGAAAGAYGTAWLILPRKDGLYVGYASSF